MNGVKYIILDESDRMLDMGFQTEMDKIFDGIHENEKQVLLFSATLPEWVQNVKNSAILGN